MTSHFNRLMKGVVESGSSSFETEFPTPVMRAAEDDKEPADKDADPAVAATDPATAATDPPVAATN